MPTSRLRRVGWQRQRKFGATGHPEFFEMDLATGLKLIPIDFVDWGGGEGTDESRTQAQLVLELIDVSNLSNDRLHRQEVTFVKVGQLYYRFIGARKVIGERNDWIVRCAISGETDPPRKPAI